MSLATHKVPAAQFGQLAAGRGDPATIATLRAGQLSKHLLLIRAVIDAAAGGEGSGQLSRAYDLLTSVQRTHPAVVEAAVLHPHVGAWAVRCLERLYGLAEPDTAGPDIPVEADLGYLAGVAAAAAIRAGTRFEIDVPVREGTVLLPGLGIAKLPSGGEQGATAAGDGASAWVAASGTRVVVPAASARDTRNWTGLRRLRACAGDLEITVDLDDLDPYRGHAYPDVAGRLPDTEAREWTRLFGAGWSLLVRHHRPYAEGLAAGLRSVVPQVSGEPGRSVSATSTDAFGSIAMSRPADEAALAVTLIHEFQHGKLSALLDLVPLYEIRSGARYYAPWRDDPRPLGGLLQGTYAFLGVTDFWRVHRNAVSAASADLASFEFARWREQTARAADELAGSAELTSAGLHFIDGLRATLRAWAIEQVPAALADQARDSAADHRARWRARNLRPEDSAIARLAIRWQAGEQGGAEPFRTEVVTGTKPARAETAQFRLWHLRITDPDRFDAVCAGEERGGEWADISDADLACLRGDCGLATTAYRDAIAAAPERVSNWVGLGLAHLRSGDARSGYAVLDRPEILIPLYLALRAKGESPAPDALARWLAGGTRPAQQGDAA